jgi:hypothetical protein
MEKIKVDEKIFKFKYLPDYAGYLLKNKLEEFVTVGIRFAREVDLPMLKPLAKIPEKQLVELSLESNKQILSALVNNTVGSFIQSNLNNWMDNKLGIIDKFEIVAEDLTLAYHIRRKLFSHFLYGYTKSAPIQQSIINEIDVYTSMEELISLKAFLRLQQELNAK